MATMTKKEWEDKGAELFGPDKKKWKFKCPSCGRVQSYESIKREMEEGAFNPRRMFPVKDGKQQPNVYSECTSPECNWVAYGLFSGPVTVILDPEKDYNEAKKENCVMTFEFAEEGELLDGRVPELRG